MVLHCQGFPERLGLCFVGEVEDGSSGPVVGGDENFPVRVDRGSDVEIEPGGPGIAPEQFAVLGSYADCPLACEKDDLRNTFHLSPDRTALTQRIVQGLPNNAAILLVQGGDRFLIRSAELEVNAI